MKEWKREDGEVMIEGMFVMIITMIMLVWILGLGFLYYQRYLVTTVTNDITAKIAATYSNPESDLVMGFIEEEDLSKRNLYRGYKELGIGPVNQTKAYKYVIYMLEKTNFAGTVDDVQVDYKLVHDSATRQHIEITTKCRFKTPFGFALDFEGMDGTVTYEATSRADCTDILDYYSTVDFARYRLKDSAISKSAVVKAIDSVMKLFTR